MAQPEPPSLRLVLSFDGAVVRLVSSQPKNARAIPSDDIRKRPQAETGFWYELQDAAGTVLYRRIAQNPMQMAAEVRSDDSARPLTWQRKTEARGTFVLLVPRFKEAQSLVLFSSPLDPQAVPAAARELARIDLTKAVRS